MTELELATKGQREALREWYKAERNYEDVNTSWGNSEVDDKVLYEAANVCDLAEENLEAANIALYNQFKV